MTMLGLLTKIVHGLWWNRTFTTYTPLYTLPLYTLLKLWWYRTFHCLTYKANWYTCTVPYIVKFWWKGILRDYQVLLLQQLLTGVIFMDIHIWTLGCWLTSPCFWQEREKDIAAIGVLLQEKAKLLYEQLFPNATTPFSSSTGFGSWFTTSELA